MNELMEIIKGMKGLQEQIDSVASCIGLIQKQISGLKETTTLQSQVSKELTQVVKNQQTLLIQLDEIIKPKNVKP